MKNRYRFITFVSNFLLILLSFINLANKDFQKFFFKRNQKSKPMKRCGTS